MPDMVMLDEVSPFYNYEKIYRMVLFITNISINMHPELWQLAISLPSPLYF